MKKLLIYMCCLSGLNLFGQDNSIPTDNNQPHTGFQVSVFGGGMAGNIHSSISGLGDVEMKGSRILSRIHIGYANKNWAGGLSFGSSTMTISSMVVNGSSYTSNSSSSITSNLIGLYFKRHFMPINMFACADVGISKFGIIDANSKLIGATDPGFAWNLAVGKEFLIGKRKRLGLGAYINLAGAKCHDIPPYENDTYSFISPGMGFVFSYR